MAIQDSINQMLGTAAAASFAVNKALDPKAAEFEKEAKLIRQNQIDASNEYLGNERPELEKQINEAQKANTDLEIFKRGIDESGADPTAGQQRYMKGLEKKGSKLTDLQAAQKAADDLEGKRQALIADIRKRLLNNNSIIQKAKAVRDLEGLHNQNVAIAITKAMDQGGTK